MNSAADDPSGYTIAQTFQSKVNGLQQSVTNVQTANNLLNVADGALSTVQLILQRINSLVVESRSDLNSVADQTNIQTEINQLLLEVNRIGGNTNFNGLNLFDGQFDTSQGTTTGTITQVASPVGGTGSTVVNETGTGGSGPLITGFGIPPAGSIVPALMVFQVIGYSNNAVDPDSGTPVGPGVYVQFTAYSTSSAAGAAPLYQDTSAVAVNSGQIGPTQYATANGTSVLMYFTLANLTEADVGATIAFVSTDTVAPGGGHQLNVDDGGDEGTTVGFSLPTVSTNALGISGISVLPTTTVGEVNGVINQLTGESSSNNLPAAAAELAVNSALEQISTARAQIGAQTVALQEDAGNDSTAIVSYQATESNITGADIGTTVTDFTKQQILTQVGTSVLSHLEISAVQLSALLIGALSTGGATAT